MTERTAAISWLVVMPYLLIAEIKYGAAWTLVSHSPAAGAPVHVPEVGAIWRICSAADGPARAEISAKVGAGIGVETDTLTKKARVRIFDSIVKVFVYV